MLESFSFRKCGVDHVLHVFSSTVSYNANCTNCLNTADVKLMALSFDATWGCGASASFFAYCNKKDGVAAAKCSLVSPFPACTYCFISGRCSTDLLDFGIGEPCVVVKPLECKRGIASKLNGQLEFTVVIEKASDADQRQYELEKQVG